MLPLAVLAKLALLLPAPPPKRALVLLVLGSLKLLLLLTLPLPEREEEVVFPLAALLLRFESLPDCWFLLARGKRGKVGR